MTQSRENAEATSFAEAFEASLNFKTPEQGELLKGQIVSISGDDAFISYGGPSEAVMSAAELEGLDVGDTVEATVVKTGSEIRISRKMLKGKASLDQLRQMFENRLPVEGKVTGRNKGGFDVSVAGLRGFCPLSQIALGKIDNPDAFIGETYEFRVTEMSDDGRRIVVSRAALMKDAAAGRAEETRRTIVPGAVLTGRVKTITPFGAFVDLGGVDGLLHVSEMSRRRVTDPKEVVTVGQEVNVKVIKVDNEGKRISLSMKDQEPDPWSDVADRFPVGSQFSGRIVRSTDFGYFVEVEPGLDGLVHLSQLPLGVKPSDSSMQIGAHVTGWVREVDASKKRLSLSLREIATNDPWEGVQQRYPVGKVIEATVDHGGAPGVFLQLEPGLTGLMPNSEIPVPAGSDAGRAFSPGEKLMVRVMSVDPTRKRISLSAEAAKVAAEHDEDMKFGQGQRPSYGSESESAMTVAFRRALERRSSASVRNAAKASRQQPFEADVTGLDDVRLQTALRDRLRYRHWIVDRCIGFPFSVSLHYPAELFDDLLVDRILDGSLLVRFDISDFVSASEIGNVDTAVLLALFPSGAIRGVSATIEVRRERVRCVLIDPLALIDPDEPMDVLPANGIAATVQVMVLRVLDYGNEARSDPRGL